MAKNAVNLNPETYLEGGGLIDDVDATVKEARFELFDYAGKSPTKVPALKLSLEVDGDVHDQYYSMGSAKDWMPSDDGKQLLAIGSATGIRKSTNGAILMISLIDNGFPADDLGDDISVIDGLKAHFIQVPAPERKGLKKDSNKKYEDTILVISEILAMPGEKSPAKGKGKATGKGKGKAAGKAAAKDTGTDEVADVATGAILGVLADNPVIAKNDLIGKLFTSLKGNPHIVNVMKLVNDDSYLEGSDQWNYSDGTLVAEG